MKVSDIGYPKAESWISWDVNSQSNLIWEHKSGISALAIMKSKIEIYSSLVIISFDLSDIKSPQNSWRSFSIYFFNS